MEFISIWMLRKHSMIRKGKLFITITMIKLILVDIHNIRNGPTTFDLSIFAAPKYLQFIRKKHKVSVSISRSISYSSFLDNFGWENTALHHR